jgi:hypothetical protein
MHGFFRFARIPRLSRFALIFWESSRPECNGSGRVPARADFPRGKTC